MAQDNRSDPIYQRAHEAFRKRVMLERPIASLAQEIRGYHRDALEGQPIPDLDTIAKHLLSTYDSEQRFVAPTHHEEEIIDGVLGMYPGYRQHVQRYAEWMQLADAVFEEAFLQSKGETYLTSDDHGKLVGRADDLFALQEDLQTGESQIASFEFLARKAAAGGYFQPKPTIAASSVAEPIKVSTLDRNEVHRHFTEMTMGNEKTGEFPSQLLTSKIYRQNVELFKATLAAHNKNYGTDFTMSEMMSVMAESYGTTLHPYMPVSDILDQRYKAMRDLYESNSLLDHTGELLVELAETYEEIFNRLYDAHKENSHALIAEVHMNMEGRAAGLHINYPEVSEPQFLRALDLVARNAMKAIEEGKIRSERVGRLNHPAGAARGPAGGVTGWE